MMNIIRKGVSKNKLRWEHDGFSLDLSYIEDNIIAMGWPATGAEGWYRNPRAEVKRFLDDRHAGRYRVYNLCGEENRDYAPDVFEGRVARFGFLDHEPPCFSMIQEFCADAEGWIRARPEDNVAVIHCKAGKGRTGMMISSLLLQLGVAETAEEAMRIYGQARTSDGKGVTIPSQIRYVGYYKQFLDAGGIIRPLALKLRGVRVVHMPCRLRSESTMLRVVERASPLAEGGAPLLAAPEPVEPGSKDMVWVLRGEAEWMGDVELSFLAAGGKAKFRLYINTCFVEGCEGTFPRHTVDMASKGKEFKDDFSVSVSWELCADTPLRRRRRHLDEEE